MKRSEYLIPISREHHFTLLFCWKIRMGIKANISYKRISDYVLYFWEHLMRPHFEQEERHLLTDRSNELIQKALDEHRLIETQIVKILLPDNESKKELLLNLAGMVERHTRFEERVLFPHIEEICSKTALINIGKNLVGNTNKCNDSYMDQFWKGLTGT